MKQVTLVYQDSDFWLHGADSAVDEADLIHYGWNLALLDEAWSGPPEVIQAPSKSVWGTFTLPCP